MNDYPLYSLLEDTARPQPSERHAAMTVAELVDRYLAPQSVLDLGCGNGTWLDVLASRAPRDILGVEEESVGPRDLAVDPARVLNASLARPLDLDRSFDLVLCLQGPDHVEPQFAKVLVGNCTRHADAVLFCVGLPSEVGSDSERGGRWIELFRNEDFQAVDLVRPLIWQDPRIPACYRQHLWLFLHQDVPQLATLQAEARRLSMFSPMHWTDTDIGYHPTFSAEFDDRRVAELTNRLVWQAERLHSAAEHEAAHQRELQTLGDSLARMRRQERAYRTEIERLGGAVQQARDEAAAARSRADTLQDHIDKLNPWIEGLQRTATQNATNLEHAQSTIAALRQERAIIVNSTIWRATEPLRAFGRMLPVTVRMRLRALLYAPVTVTRSLSRVRARRRQHTAPPPAASAPPHEAPSAQTPAPSSGPRVLIISGEAHTPGHAYRVLRLAAAFESLGTITSWMRVEDWDRRPGEIEDAQIVVIWRAPYSSTTAAIVKAARARGAKIVFDLDDLMVKPELACVEVIDGIRTQRVSAEGTARLFAQIQKLALHADICTCTTQELADHFRELLKVAYVLPNGFDDDVHRTARLAVRRRQAGDGDGLIRIGYAGGSRTHQRDFSQVADAVARILRERPECRLVLFRKADENLPVIDIEEFPALLACRKQIEWRDMVPPATLPFEIARFDINLTPLEIGNAFCESKSELKYFEAALTEVCSVASRTGPMERAIQDHVTGRLIGAGDDWYDAILELIDNPDLRQRMAHAAYLDVYWRYGPRRRSELVQGLMDQLAGGEAAARAFELELRRGSRRATAFDIPDSETVLCADNGRSSDVCVIVPLYNYAHYVREALDSVHAQTLAELDLVVVDDRSTDDSLAVALDWVRSHPGRFNRVVVKRNRTNAGLARSRNVGFDTAETPFVLPLDADNRLLPDCLSRLLAELRGSRAAFAYPLIQSFGDRTNVFGGEAFSPGRFAGGNYVDAMALVCKWAWTAVGGYVHVQYGWEDYDFWCRCVEQGFWGQQVGSVLAEYRVHKQSMLSTETDRRENKLKLIRTMKASHQWLTIPHRD
jgi:glycosyltransferase involved in cell wall biosynthesis/SAM-dependent methyltransferase